MTMLLAFPTRRSSDLQCQLVDRERGAEHLGGRGGRHGTPHRVAVAGKGCTSACRSEPGGRTPRSALHALVRSEEHTSELQSRRDLVCRLLREKKNKAK